MKKISNLLTSFAIISSVVFMPAAALAQDVPVVEVGTSDTTEPATTDTTTTAGVPETGIAPQPSKLAQNTAVFLIGGTVGAAVGLGLVTYKKKKSQSSSQL